MFATSQHAHFIGIGGIGMSGIAEILKAIRSRGMRVFVALHHFTHPTWFEYKGAFTSHEGPEHFRLFAERAVTEFGDLCTDWITFNEPNVYAAFGYLFGEFPPGRV